MVAAVPRGPPTSIPGIEQQQKEAAGPHTSCRLLARGVDPPWQFELEVLSLEGGEPPKRGAPSTPREGPPAEDSPGHERGAPHPPSVAVGALDFAAPAGFIFLAPWVMEALGIQSGDAVFCRVASLPTGGSVRLRAQHSAFFTEAEAAGGVQKALERELRHYSALTAGTCIPIKLGTRIFLFNVEQVLTEEGKEVPSASVQDTDVALQLLPPNDGPPTRGPRHGGQASEQAREYAGAPLQAEATAAAVEAAATVENHVPACENPSQQGNKKTKRSKGVGGPPRVEEAEGVPPEPEDSDLSAKRKKGVLCVISSVSEDREALESSPGKKKRLKQQTEGQQGGGPEAAEAAEEEEARSGGGAPRGPRKLRRKREGCWGPEEIAARKAELLKELGERRESLSVSRMKRIKARLAELSKAEQGLKQVGGQLAKVSSKKRQKHSDKMHAAREGNARKRKRDAHADKDISSAPHAKRSKKICLRCRKRGHVLQECRQGAPQEAGETPAVSGICFNCGSSSHTLKACKKPRAADGSLPFALCFICNGKGHISSQCPKSTTGKYPKGGCCRTCGSIYHLQVECPTFKAQREKLQQQRQAKKAGVLQRGDCEKSVKRQKEESQDNDAYWMQQLKA
ncbi:hypothetical protein Esti_000266 [Eimeria stiedai]